MEAYLPVSADVDRHETAAVESPTTQHGCEESEGRGLAATAEKQRVTTQGLVDPPASRLQRAAEAFGTMKQRNSLAADISGGHAGSTCR